MLVIEDDASSQKTTARYAGRVFRLYHKTYYLELDIGCYQLTSVPDGDVVFVP